MTEQELKEMPSHRRVRQIISTQWLHQSIAFQGHFERK